WAQQHVRRGVRERIREASWPRRLAACRGARLDELLDALADRQERPPHVAVRTAEEPVEHVAPTDLLRGVVERRRGEEASRRIAGEEIADRGAALREESVAVRDPAHDLAGVFGMVRDHEAAGLLVPPPKARDAVVVPVEDA